MICKHLTIKEEETGAFWWCSKFSKYEDFKRCTILPCNPEISLGGCKQAELSDTEKIQLEEAKKSKFPIYLFDI